MMSDEDLIRRLWASDYANALTNEAARRIEALTAIAVQPQCCMCGKRDLSTAEDGGPECELHDGRWACSRECYDKAYSPPTFTAADLEAACRVGFEMAARTAFGPRGWGPQNGQSIPTAIRALKPPTDLAARVEEARK
jgi:hypothetical protein